MHVYSQTSTSTTLPERSEGASGLLLSQPLAPSNVKIFEFAESATTAAGDSASATAHKKAYIYGRPRRSNRSTVKVDRSKVDRSKVDRSISFTLVCSIRSERSR